MGLTIGHKLTLAFAAAVAILLATAVASYRNTRELLATSEAAREAHEILDLVDAVAQSAKQAVGGRSTALGTSTREERAGAAAASGALREAIAALSSAVSADSVRAERVQVIDSLLAPRGALPARVAGTVDLDSGAPTSARAPESDGARLVALLEEWRAAERAALRVQSSVARAAADRAEFILRVGVVLVVLLAPIALFMMRGDMLVRREVERALAESEARFRAATDGSLDAFYVLRAVRDGAGELLDFEFVDLNRRAEALLSHGRTEVLGQRLCELIPANRTLGFVEKYRQVMESGVVLEEECEVTSRDYHAAWIHHQVVPLIDGVAITSRDITERKRQEDALRALSLVDELTGLYNRRGFLTLAQQQLKLARRGHRELVLLFIDMDDFKEINDTLGHHEGDIALTRAAGVLRHTFRDSDIIARMGGDEFVVLATDTGKTGSEVIIDRLRHELWARNAGDGYPYTLSFSVGAARFDPDAPPSIEELLAAADAMLYEQKRHKRQPVLSGA